MSDLSQELQVLLEETTAALGATDQTYIQFLKLMQDNSRLSIPSRLFQGQMIFFKYDPVSQSFISRNTYYDRFPLVLITDVYRGGFEGINLHFIHPDYRKFLFDTIMRYLPVVKASVEWRNRVLVDYDRLKARRQFKFFRPCYRRYSWKGMMRRPVIVPFDLWEQMVEGNTFRFVNAKPVTVHRDSKEQVIKRGR